MKGDSSSLNEEDSEESSDIEKLLLHNPGNDLDEEEEMEEERERSRRRQLQMAEEVMKMNNMKRMRVDGVFGEVGQIGAIPASAAPSLGAPSITHTFTNLAASMKSIGVAGKGQS